MLKYLIALFLFTSFFLSANAQSATDTLIYYVKNDGNVVQKKDSADFILVVSPSTSIEAKKSYPVLGFYLDGKKKIITNSSTQQIPLKLEGPFLSYFPSGKRMVFSNYKDGELYGDEVDYYPNGKIYAQKKHDNNGVLLMECRDSIGKVLATNGTGKWLVFNDDFSSLESDGVVVGGHITGNWNHYGKTKTFDEGNYKYIITPSGKAYVKVEVEPQFIGGIEKFGKFLEKNIHYPNEDREQNLMGKVFVTFIIETDGSLSNIEALRGPSLSLKKEAMRVIRLSPKWIPGSVYGKPVRVAFTVPIAFSMGLE